MTVKKFFTIFALTLCICILGICIFLMIHFYNESKKEEADSTRNKVTEAPTPTPEPTPEPTPTPTPEPTPKEPDYMSMFFYNDISDDVKTRILGISYSEDAFDRIPMTDLKYCHIMYYNFNGDICEGEMIVNALIADDTIDVFKELFEIKYPIQKMVLIDEYGADDESSMADNNTSAFNFRFISGTTTLSNHAMGFAIDINPLFNPYIFTNKDGETIVQPANGQPFVNRNSNARYIIHKDDECYNIFISHGFSWGGDWETKKDYQHFEKVVTEE